jgi:CubicO group peptidase (beta-lactamase class C family)
MRREGWGEGREEGRGEGSGEGRGAGDRLRVVEVLDAGIADGTHIGAQLYVSHRGAVVADVALGRARSDVDMRTDTLMTWFSITKAVTAVAVAQQWERGALDPDVPVLRHVPEFAPPELAGSGKERITLRHLLTHTAGLANADGILQATPWQESRAENLARIYAAKPDYEPGTRAGYHAAAGMSVLGEVVARVSGVPYDRYVREEIFEPLGMDDCWVGMPGDRYDAYGDRIGFMHTTSAGTAERLRGMDSARVLAEPMPGANGRGPMNQLGRFYEMLVGHGTRDGVRVLSPATVAAIASRHRTEMLDETYGVVMDWGLGLAVDWYATGRYSSRRAFGHGGHQSSVAFCDPQHDLVVAVVCNGMPGRERHSARLDAISSAVYVDVGIADAADPGRSKPFPVLGL